MRSQFNLRLKHPLQLGAVKTLVIAYISLQIHATLSTKRLPRQQADSGPGIVQRAQCGSDVAQILTGSEPALI